MKDKIFQGKLLVVSNECFSGNSSNGRTMMTLLSGFSPEQLGQFYLHGRPDKAFCAHYFRVSDEDALAALLHRKRPAPPVDGQAPSAPRRVTRNYKNLVLRDTVWQTWRWWSAELDAFLRDFAPDAVLLQAGDMPFMYAIALRIAKKCGVPFLMYNSEGYVLKKRMYNGTSALSVWHRILQGRLRRVYRRAMRRAAYCIYNTEYLENCYQQKYPHPGKSAALYTASEMPPLPDETDPDVFRILYCGNLGVGRIEMLAKIGRVIRETGIPAVLDVYGKIPDEAERPTLDGTPCLSYHGIVPYEEVPRLMSRAAVVLHCENEARIEDLIHAFSTKIADCLACGRPFLVFATHDFPFVQYLKKNNCAHVAENEAELKAFFERAVVDRAYLTQYIPAARQLAARNHSAAANFSAINEILSRVTQK